MTDFSDPDESLTNDEERPFTDQESAAGEADELVTNDAVAGETVWAGGEGSDGSATEPNWDRFAPGQSAPDESQPFGDKTPDDLRDHLDPHDVAPVVVTEAEPEPGSREAGDWTERPV